MLDYKEGIRLDNSKSHILSSRETVFEKMEEDIGGFNLSRLK